MSRLGTGFAVRLFPALVVFFGLGACETAAIQKAPKAAPTPAAITSSVASPSPSTEPPLTFPVEVALEHTRVLSVDIGKRSSGSSGEKAAADYIEGEFQRQGYEVSRREFKRADGGMSANIVARSKQTDYSKGYVLVGGHYDTKGPSPGGNDNGSGIGVILALAQTFATRPVAVEFVGFAAEEVHPVTRRHHEGSRHYAAALADASIVKAMVSVDMVGNGDLVYLVVWNRSSLVSLQTEFAGLAGQIGVPTTSKTMGDLSDHTSFLRVGVPSVLVWSGDHPTLHRATDTFEVVERDSVERSGKLLLEWLKLRTGV